MSPKFTFSTSKFPIPSLCLSISHLLIHPPPLPSSLVSSSVPLVSLFLLSPMSISCCFLIPPLLHFPSVLFSTTCYLISPCFPLPFCPPSSSSTSHCPLSFSMPHTTNSLPVLPHPPLPTKCPVFSSSPNSLFIFIVLSTIFHLLHSPSHTSSSTSGSPSVTIHFPLFPILFPAVSPLALSLSHSISGYLTIL